MSSSDGTESNRVVEQLVQLVRLLARKDASAGEQRDLVAELVKSLAAGEVGISLSDDGALLINGSQHSPQSDSPVDSSDMKFLAAQLAAYGVEELKITPKAARADLLDLARLLGTPATGSDPVATFASRSAVIDSRAIPRRLKQRAVPEPVQATPGSTTAQHGSTPRSTISQAGITPRSTNAQPGVTPRSTTAQPGVTPRSTGQVEEREVLKEPPAWTGSTDESVNDFRARLLNADSESGELKAVLDEISLAIDLAFRRGQDSVMVELLSAVLDVEYKRAGLETSEKVRLTFSRALRRSAKPLLLRRFAMLRHQSASDAQAADWIGAILFRFGNDGVEALIDEYTAAPTVEARGVCVAALREMRSTWDVLRNIARETGTVHHRYIASLAAALGGERAGPLLIELLRNSDDFVRLSAVVALGRIPVGTAEFGAISLALEDDIPSVRSAAVTTLATLGDPRAVRELSTLVATETEPSVLYLGISALGVIGGNDAVQLLVPLAEGTGTHPRAESAEYRIHAATALAMIRTPAAMACVQQLRDDRDRDVRDASRRLVAQAKRRTTSSQAIISGP